MKVQTEKILKLEEEIYNLKHKKPTNTRISLGSTNRHHGDSIPVVKITVPNIKQASHETENEALFRQVRTAGEEISNLKKILES